MSFISDLNFHNNQFFNKQQTKQIKMDPIKEELNPQDQTSTEQVSKDEKKYQETVAIVEAVLGGSMKTPKKVAKDKMVSLVSELFKEEEEQIYVEAKQELKSLIKAHVKMQSDIAEKERELKKLTDEKKKEFVQASSKLLNKIDQQHVRTETYAQALNTALGK